MNEPVDLLIDTPNPDDLDRILQQFGAALIGGGMPQGYARRDGHYIARVFGNADFVEFMVNQQGYGTVVGRREELA